VTTPSEDRTWISIAKQVSVEMDSAKLAVLIEQLCCALDNRGRRVEDVTTREI
jgi:hypothetical protein